MLVSPMPVALMTAAERAGYRAAIAYFLSLIHI